MEKAVVQIIGAPIACAEGIKDAWRETAVWAAKQLEKWYGDQVELVYHDLFDLNCPPLPAEAQLPVVLVQGEVVSMGGKISLPAIRKKLKECGTAALNA